MRAAKSMPWDNARAAVYRTIFPQMSQCLSEDEGAQLRFQFEEELAGSKSRSGKLDGCPLAKLTQPDRGEAFGAAPHCTLARCADPPASVACRSPQSALL